jgi:chromosome segregation ATPase
MFVSARDALSSVEDAISGVRTNESRLAQVLSSAAAEAERLRKQLSDAYRGLALIRLDNLVRNEAVGEIDAAERRALDLLRTYKAKLDQLLIRHGGAQSTVVAAETDNRAKTAAVEAAATPIKTLQAEVEAKMKADPAWTAQRARVDEIAATAHAADEKAHQAEADRDTKRTPYEGDPLFMYLWTRKFATADYHAGNFARFFDRKVAALVGYDTARPNYALLAEIPLRLREHADRLVKQVEAEDHKLEEIERAALVAAGIAPLEQKLAEAQASLKAATETLTKAQAALTALDQEKTKLLEEGDRRAHDEALAVLSQAIAREDLQTMYREAQATRTPDDDRLVQQVEQTQKSIASADAEVAKIRDEAREVARRRGELEGVRDNFRRNRYDGPWGQFEFGRGSMDDMIGGIVRGAIQGAVLWSLFERGYRRHNDWSDQNWGGGPWGAGGTPRFRLPSSSMPKIGGFGTGGGFRGGGFKTGGRF